MDMNEMIDELEAIRNATKIPEVNIQIDAEITFLRTVRAALRQAAEALIDKNIELTVKLVNLAGEVTNGNA